jgi:hypothetical protein
LAGAAPRRDGVDPAETGRHPDPDERADGVLAVAQPLQGPVAVAHRRHAQQRRGSHLQPREDVPPRRRSQPAASWSISTSSTLAPTSSSGTFLTGICFFIFCPDLI